MIAASAGNHALALAYHGHLLNVPVTVVTPKTAPIMKARIHSDLQYRLSQDLMYTHSVISSLVLEPTPSAVLWFALIIIHTVLTRTQNSVGPGNDSLQDQPNG